MPRIGETPDESELAQHAMALADGLDAALATWVESCVARLSLAWSGTFDEPTQAAAAAAGRQAQIEVGPRVRALLAADVDDQRTTPLSLVRGAVRYPTEVLRAMDVPPVVRDRAAEEAFPDDDYDLVPASFADVAPELAELGLIWGAAKAHVVLSRRRQRG